MSREHMPAPCGTSFRPRWEVWMLLSDKQKSPGARAPLLPSTWQSQGSTRAGLIEPPPGSRRFAPSWSGHGKDRPIPSNSHTVRNEGPEWQEMTSFGMLTGDRRR